MYNFKLNLYSGGSKIGSFNVANLFDNIIVDIHSNKDYSGRYMNNISINQTRKVFPRDSFSKESTFYINGRSNKDIDSRFGFSDPKTLLTGNSLVSSHMAYDSHLRLNYYDKEIERLIKSALGGKITTTEYAMMRFQLQKATKSKLSVIGQNLSEFPPFGKSLAAQKAHAEAIANGKKPMPAGWLSTRKTTNTSAKIIRGVGTGIVVVSAAQSVYSIVKSENKGEALAKEGIGWGASIAGGEIGMQAGATLGGSVGVCFGGIGYAPGAAFGGFIGGIAGGIGGYIWGMDAMNDFLNNNSNVKNSKGFGGGFGGGGYSGGGTSGGW